MKGYFLVLQFEIGVNAHSVSEALAQGEKWAKIIKNVLKKELPVNEKVNVFLTSKSKNEEISNNIR